MQDLWEPPEREKFRRETANVTFHTRIEPPGFTERAASMMLGAAVGVALGVLYWFVG